MPEPPPRPYASEKESMAALRAAARTSNDLRLGATRLCRQVAEWFDRRGPEFLGKEFPVAYAAKAIGVSRQHLYLLGDIGLHNRELSLSSWEETDRAFARAVELDPLFGPYRLHGVELAFSVADSALAAERLEESERVGSDPEHAWRVRTALVLAYGDSAARAAARAALDTADIELIRSALGSFLTPDARLWRIEEELGQALERRGELGPGFERVLLADVSLKHGALAEHLDRLSDPKLLHFIRICSLVFGQMRGLPIDDGFVEAARAAIDTTDERQEYCAAIYAAQRERWDDHAQLLERLVAHRDSSLTASNPTMSRLLSAAVEGARGVAEWRRGRPAARGTRR